MVDLSFDSEFKRLFSKIKNKDIKGKILKQIAKIKENPKIGKPMRYSRKGTRELYIPSFRLSYIYHKEKELIVLLDLYHKDVQ